MMAHARQYCIDECGINVYSNSSVSSFKALLTPLVACKVRWGAQETPRHACCILSAPLKLVKVFAGGASLRRQQGHQQSAAAEELSGIITSLIRPREQRRCQRQFSGSSPSRNRSFGCAAYWGGGQAACHRSLKLRRSLSWTPTQDQTPR